MGKVVASFCAWWKGLPSFLFLIKDGNEDRGGVNEEGEGIWTESGIGGPWSSG